MKVKVHIKLKSVLSLFCLEWCGGKRGRVKSACSKVTPHSPGNKRLVYPGMFQSIFTIMSWSTLHAAFLLSFCSQIHCGQGWFEPGAAIKKKKNPTLPPPAVSLFHLAVCSLPQIRGMSIDEAIAQLEFNDKKGAKIMKEVRSRMFTLCCWTCVFNEMRHRSHKYF